GSVLNGNLNVFREVTALRDGSLVSDFVQTNLMSAIYWLLADAVTRGTARRCVHCGRPFIATDERTIYCPRPMGEEGQSLCLNRERQRRFRQRHAGSRRSRPQRQKDTKGGRP